MYAIVNFKKSVWVLIMVAGAATMLVVLIVYKKSKESSNSICNLIGEKFDVTRIHKIWPSNTVYVSKKRITIVNNPTNLIIESNIYTVNRQDMVKSHFRNDSDGEYIRPIVDIITNKRKSDNDEMFVALEVYSANADFFDKTCKYFDIRPITYNDAIALESNQMWKTVLYNDCRGMDKLNYNKVWGSSRLGKKCLSTCLLYDNKQLVSLTVSSTNMHVAASRAKLRPLIIENGELDLSYMAIRTTWVLPQLNSDNESTSNRHLQMLAVGRTSFDRMTDSGIQFDRRVYNYAEPVSRLAGYYSASNGAVIVKTAITDLGSNSIEDVRHIFVDIVKIGPNTKVLLPCNLELPSTEQDCRKKYKLCYERRRFDGLMVLLASEKASFLFENGRFRSVLYYENTGPVGDELAEMLWYSTLNR